MRTLKSLLVLAAAFGLASCEKYALDRQMNELCKVDGGIVVYEVVTLPASRFDAAGNLVPDSPYREGMNLGEHLVGSNFVLEHVSETIVAGDPFKGVIAKGRLLRFVTRVRRLSDQKILAREVAYGRTGGDLSLGHPSQNFCPNPRPEVNLLQSTFRKGE